MSVTKKIYLGENFKNYLESKVISVPELAKEAGLSQPSLYDILNEKTKKPRPQNLRRIAKGLSKLIGANQEIQLRKDDNGIYFAISKTNQGNLPEYDSNIMSVLGVLLTDHSLNQKQLMTIIKILKLLKNVNEDSQNKLLSLMEASVSNENL